VKAGIMELQFSRDPLVSLIFEDTLDEDTETLKSDSPTCSGDSETEQEDQAKSVSYNILLAGTKATLVWTSQVGLPK